MSEEKAPFRGNAQKVEAKIYFEAPRKTFLQVIVVWLVRSALSLVLLLGGIYAFFNFTPAGGELKAKYEARCRETDQLLDEGIDCCRFYVSYFGRPPASAEDIVKFQTDRLMNPRQQYRLPDGRSLPYWNGKDGFGREVDIKVDPQARTIKLTSPGFLPLAGHKPAIFDYVREASY